MYVYVISAGERRHKIGKASDPNARLHDLQCGAHDELRLVFTAEIGARAIEIERAAHGLIRDRRLRREWFDITAEDAIDAVKRAISGERASKPRRNTDKSWWKDHPPISVRIPDELLEQVGEWAKTRGVKRHAALLQLLEMGLKE